MLATRQARGAMAPCPVVLSLGPQGPGRARMPPFTETGTWHHSLCPPVTQAQAKLSLPEVNSLVPGGAVGGAVRRRPPGTQVEAGRADRCSSPMPWPWSPFPGQVSPLHQGRRHRQPLWARLEGPGTPRGRRPGLPGSQQHPSVAQWCHPVATTGHTRSQVPHVPAHRPPSGPAGVCRLSPCKDQCLPNRKGHKAPDTGARSSCPDSPWRPSVPAPSDAGQPWSATCSLPGLWYAEANSCLWWPGSEQPGTQHGASSVTATSSRPRCKEAESGLC